MVTVVAKAVIDKATGSIVDPGATVRDFRGDDWELVSGTDVTVPGKSGKVHVQRRACEDGSTGVVERWLYASVFGLYVVGLMSCGCPAGPEHGSHLDTCNEE